jgi:phenylalanyl-tRNA synthetase beta chain
MKVSLNLAQYYSNVDLKQLPHDEILRRIGAQLGAVEEVTDWGARYDSIFVVKVEECIAHPDSDHMHVCKINDGGAAENVERDERGLITVVCGASNIAAGQLVAWLAPGSTLPASYDEQEKFVLGSRKLRGIMSNGMIGSERELCISEEHEGILIIDRKGIDDALLTPGTPFKKLYGLDDLIIDCENKMFTHRPDCFGNLGVAREIAGIFGLGFKSPDWYRTQPLFDSAKSLPLNVDSQTEACVRFMAVAMDNITIAKSPLWMRSTLTRLGYRSINNVVDVTNFVMHLTAQPLHAFDYDKLKKIANTDEITLGPRMARAGECLELLNGKKILLTEGDIVIVCNDEPVALAGVMGGAATEVDVNTKRVVIECATFDMYTIRRTSMRHGIFSDAVTRFNKGQSFLQNDRVLAYVMKNMTECAGALQASDVLDFYDCDTICPQPFEYSLGQVIVTPEFINSRLGTTISSEQMQNMLKNVEIGVEDDGTNLTITVPFWRTDLKIAEDIVEEIGRLYGYDKVAATLPMRSTAPAAKNQLREFKANVRLALKELGANELLTYSFVHGDLLRKTGVDPDQTAFHLRNALSPELQYYRTSITPSLLTKVHANIKSKAGSLNNRFALFEIGKVHNKIQIDESGLPVQHGRIALVCAADDKTAKSYYHGSPFYQVKFFLQCVAGDDFTLRPLTEAGRMFGLYYDVNRSAEIVINDVVVGILGEYSVAVKNALKLPRFSAGFECDIALLQRYVKAKKYEKMGQFPASSQDVTVECQAGVKVQEILDISMGTLKQISAEHGYRTTLCVVDIFKPEKSDPVRRITLRLTVSHPDKTLKTNEVTHITTEVFTALEAALAAKLV